MYVLYSITLYSWVSYKYIFHFVLISQVCEILDFVSYKKQSSEKKSCVATIENGFERLVLYDAIDRNISKN